jgi:hypothetical protein
MNTPREEDIITNSDESKRLPDENPEPLEGMKKEERDIVVPEPEEKKEKGKAAITNQDAANTHPKDGDQPETNTDNNSPTPL